MRALLAAAVLTISGTAYAHPGHTAPEPAMHFLAQHGWITPLAIVVGGALLLAFAWRRQ